MAKRDPISAGDVFSRLTVLKELPAERNSRVVLCICSCGKETKCRVSVLRSGYRVSCGCFRIERVRAAKLKHGHASNGKPTREYYSWRSMHCRCYVPKTAGYKYYGGRGIKVCERWHSFENFLEDMGRRPAGKSLDRFPDKDGDYEPGNCRWATSGEQLLNRNKRVVLL